VGFFYTRVTTDQQTADDGVRTVQRLEIGLPFSPWYVSETSVGPEKNWRSESVLKRLVTTWSGALGLLALALFAAAWPSRESSAVERRAASREHAPV
jgi:hypothetical protein